MKKLFVCLLLMVMVASLAHAKKPVKMSKTEMSTVEGAIAPLIIVGAMCGAYALSVSIDLLSDPEFRDAVGGWTDGVAKGDLNSAHGHSQIMFDKEVKAMTDPINIIAGLSGGVGEVAGAAYKGAAGTVKIGAKGAEATKPFVYGAGKEVVKQGAKTAFEAPATCLVENDLSAGENTTACIGEKFNDKVSDPMTWAQIVAGGMARGESYNVRSGYEGARLWDASQLKKNVNAADKIIDIAGKVTKKNGESESNKPVNNWVVDNKQNDPPKELDLSFMNIYPGGNVIVVEKENGAKDYYYEVPSAPTYQVGGKTYVGYFDEAGQPMCGVPVKTTSGKSSSSKSSSKSSGSSSSKSSAGSSSSGSTPKVSSKGTGSSAGKSSSSGKVGTITTDVAKSAIGKASSGKLDSLTPTEKAFLSNH